jgi:hypothetical protein
MKQDLSEPVVDLRVDRTLGRKAGPNVAAPGDASGPDLERSGRA